MTIVTLGPATLHLGDAYAIRPDVGFHDADVFDPPYLIRATGGGRYRKRRPMFDQIVAENLHKGFDMSIVNPLLCGGAIVFAHNDQLAELLSRVQGQFHRHALCVWQKTNPQPIANKHYRPDVEFYVHAWNRGYHPTGDLGDLLRVSRITSARGSARFGHPNTKPDALMDKILANVRGETICDPFMGTGSTGVAAIRAGKRFTGIEQNPRHFETAVQRIAAAVAELEREAA
ncbi:DNA methyltransferase [Sphingomonas koreensis]|uniref:DNA methyltransferase n=1 Tax=Sphingomonas koreensis TaxID=93064 RepID=UPI000F7F960C|nr:DNA methyltransferase [Sphingomonas koreensis]MDC7808828.1 DNA methyltransferase [Sphingomonas koreensis]RSU98967.1 site-specific DNA-methyltransferase [Sphingomonas koreensis]